MILLGIGLGLVDVAIFPLLTFASAFAPFRLKVTVQLDAASGGEEREDPQWSVDEEGGCDTRVHL